jgi:hypothetical protein
MSKDILKEKLEKGWVHAKMFFEVMGSTEEFTKNALIDHLEKIKKMENIKIVSEKTGEVLKVENPPKIFKDAYSQITEVEVVVNNFENLLYSVIFFGPSSVEIIEPKEMRVGFEAAQSMVNAVAEMMHKYAAAGAGGIVINTKK